MLPYSYKQREDAPDTARKVKGLPYVSLAPKLVAAALFVAAFFWTYYVFIAVGIALFFGIAVKQYFYSSTKEYVYIFAGDTLHVHKMNMLGSEKPVLSVDFENALGLDRDDGLEKNVLCATEKNERFKLVYVFGKQRCALVFSPDVYMRSLIKATLEGDEKELSEVWCEDDTLGKEAYIARPLNTYEPEETPAFVGFSACHEEEEKETPEPEELIPEREETPVESAPEVVEEETHLDEKSKKELLL